MALDAEILVALNLSYKSDISAGVAKDTASLQALTAETRGLDKAALSAGGSSAVATTRIRETGTASRTAAGEMEGLRVASRASAGDMDSLGVASLATKGNIALLAGSIGAYAIYQGAQLQQSLIETRNNTTQTSAQFAQMRAEILKLGNESPIGLQALADGYRQISDTGYQGANANKLMEVSLKSAASTGADFSLVASTLATTMHAMGANANEAGHYMDVLHLAANEGRLTLQDMSQVFGVVSSYAVEAGVSVEDAAAAIATMTRNGLDASTAATQFKDSVLHIINPGKQARDEIALLSKQTGVDLVKDFSQAGLSAKGLFGVMGDVKTATNGNVQEMAKLIPNMRGLLAEMVLTGKGASDYAAILHQLQNAHGQTDAAYKRSQDTLDFYLGTLHNQFVITASDIGGKLLPAIKTMSSDVKEELKPVKWTIDLIFNTPQGNDILGFLNAVREKAMSFNEISFAQYMAKVDDANTPVAALNKALDQGKINAKQYGDALNLLYGTVIGPLVAAQEEEHRRQLAEHSQVNENTQAYIRLALAKHDAYSQMPPDYMLPGPTGRPGYGPGGDTTMYSTFPGIRSLDRSGSGVANLQKAVSDAQAEVTRWVNVVHTDHDVLHTDNASHDESLRQAVAHYAALNRELSDLSSDGLPKTQKALSLHSAKLDALTAAQDAYQKALNAGYADLAAGHPITTAHAAAIKEDYEKVQKMTDAVNNIINPLHGLSDTVALTAGLMGGLASGIKGVLDVVHTPKGFGNQYLDTTVPVEVQYGQQAEPNGGYVPKPVKTPIGRYGYTSTELPAGVIAGAAAAAAASDAVAAAAAAHVQNPGGNRGGIVGPNGQLVSPQGTGVSNVQTGTDYPTLFAGIQSAVQEQTQELSTQQSLSNARLQVISAQGQLQIDGINAVVTATQDQTQIIQAQTAVDNARASATLSSINGQTGILQAMGAAAVTAIQDQGAIALDIKNGDAQKLASDRQIAAIDQKLGQDSVAIAREHMLIDAQTSANQLQAAEDGLKLAQDKALVDSANAAAQREVDMDTLNLNSAQLEELTAQTKLQSDIASILGSLAGVTVPANLQADMAAVGTAAGHVSLWQGALLDATTGKNIVNAQGQGLLANDALSAAGNAAGGAGALNSLQIILAQLLQTQAKDQTQKDLLSALAQVVSQLTQISTNTGQTATNTGTMASAQEEINTLREKLRNANDPGTNRVVNVLPALPGSNHPFFGQSQLST